MQEGFLLGVVLNLSIACAWKLIANYFVMLSKVIVYSNDVTWFWQNKPNCTSFY